MPYLTETIAEHEQRCLDRMDAIIEHDDFAPMSGEELGMMDKETGTSLLWHIIFPNQISNLSLEHRFGLTTFSKYGGVLHCDVAICEQHLLDWQLNGK